MARLPTRLDISKATRDSILFLGGFAGVVFETLHERVDRPYLLAVFTGMMGLPLFIRKDERGLDQPKHRDNGKQDDDVEGDGGHRRPIP